MSETSEQQVTTQETGRCEKAAHEVTHASWNHRFHESVFQMATAATIDRIAADVAAIKAKVDAVSPEDVAHLVESEKAFAELFAEQRDAAIRERDEARAEVERLTARLGDRAEVQQAQLSAAFTEGTLQAGDAMRARFEQVEKERDEARAEVVRLRQSRDAADRLNGATLAEVERLRAERAAPQPAAPPPAWLTAEERDAVAFAAASFRGHAIAGNLKAMADQLDALLARAAPQPAAGGWMTAREKEAIEELLPYTFSGEQVKLLANMLARAGSPPVVEVPDLPSNFYARSEAELYRVAIDKAGVPWREVPRG